MRLYAGVDGRDKSTYLIAIESNSNEESTIGLEQVGIIALPRDTNSLMAETRCDMRYAIHWSIHESPRADHPKCSY